MSDFNCDPKVIDNMIAERNSLQSQLSIRDRQIEVARKALKGIVGGDECISGCGAFAQEALRQIGEVKK